MGEDIEDGQKQHIPEPEKVPETPPPNPEPEKTPEPRQDGDLRATVDRLSEVVAGLTQKVEQMTTTEPDKTPGGTPWTHRGSVR